MKQLVRGILVTVILASQPVSATPLDEGKLSVSLTSRGSYDNNILRYSPRDRGRYFDGLESNPSPIRSLDDWRTDYKISVSYKIDLWSIGESELKSIFNFAHHARNPIKNFGWMSLFANQDLGEQLRASLNYFYEPEYYIRNYRDRHTGTFHPADFALTQLTGRVFYRPIKAIEFIGRGRLKKYYYNEYFTEYDGDLVQLGSELVFREGPWKLTTGWFTSTFDNTGYSSRDRIPPFDDFEDNEAGEADYDEDEFVFAVQYSLKLSGRRTYVRAGGTLAKRYYTTDLKPELDPLHHGREDVKKALQFSTKHYLNKAVSVDVGVEYLTRDSDAVTPLSSVLKTYYRWGSWIEISYRLR